VIFRSVFLRTEECKSHVTFVCSFLCSVSVASNRLPAVLQVDVGWEAGLYAVKILASAKCGLRLGANRGGICIRRRWLNAMVQVFGDCCSCG
jgi:hypothetical protein